MKIKSFTILLLTLLLMPLSQLFAEGSKDLYPDGITGNRAFLISKTGENEVFNPFPTLGRTMVYAKEGETIHMGSSVLGLGESESSFGKIILYSPSGDKTVYGSYNSSAQSSSANVAGRIRSRAEELAGPMVTGVSSTGYTPVSKVVDEGEEGIWVVEFYGKGTEGAGNTTSLFIRADEEWQTLNFATTTNATNDPPPTQLRKQSCLYYCMGRNSSKNGS